MKLNSYINNCFTSPKKSHESLYNTSFGDSKDIYQEQIKEISDSEGECYTYEERIEKLQKILNTQQLNEKQQQDIYFQILKLKCQIGKIGINNRSKHCTLIKKDLQNIMGQFSPNFCFIVFTGVHNDQSISIISHPINKKNYFELQFREYNVIVYEVDKNPQILRKNNRLNTNISICSIENDNLMSDSIDNLSNINNSYRNFRAPNFERSDKKQKSTYSSPNVFHSRNNSSIVQFTSTKAFQSAASQILSPQSSIFIGKENNSCMFSSNSNLNNQEQSRPGNQYLQRQIIKDELKFQESVKKFQRNNSTIIHPTIPSREKVFAIAKNYKLYLSKLKTLKNTKCNDYTKAIRKAFNEKGYEPKLIIVKRLPQGDYFWDYDCENDVAIHTWDLIKNYGVSVCI